MNEQIKTKYYSFTDFSNNREAAGSQAQLPHLYLTIYEKALAREKPVILELGTHKGVSTLMFLQAVKEKGGHVYSVDIDEQYSDLTVSPDWTFIHSDSTDVDGIIQKHPKLRDGIDILLIDSLHKKRHVEKEFWGWEPYLNKNALVIFDDVDAHIYRSGARKDHVFLEFDWEEIRAFVEETFYVNEDALFMEMHFGSTGFAILTKRTDRSVRLKQAQNIKRRTNSFFWRQYVKLVDALKNLKNSFRD